MKKRIPAVILLVLALGAAIWWFEARPGRARGGLPELHGNVDIREVNLGFRVPGKVAAVLRDEGDAVKADEMLARLDDEPYRREVEEARAQVGSVTARLKLLESGNRPQEIAQGAAIVGEREVTLANAERLYKRAEELFRNNTVSQQERDDADARYREAEARLKSAREQLALLRLGFREEEIAQARADLARAQALLAAAELKVRDSELRAPADGVVLTRAQEPGAVVQVGATVLTLSLTKPVWVRAYIHEPDLGKIHPGMKVNVYTDSHPDKPFAGQIGYISPRAEFTPKNVETRELRSTLVYRLRVVVESPDETLRQGMPVVVRVGESDK